MPVRVIHDTVPDEVVRQIASRDAVEAAHPTMKATAIRSCGPRVIESRHAASGPDRAARIEEPAAAATGECCRRSQYAVVREHGHRALDPPFQDPLDFPGKNATRRGHLRHTSDNIASSIARQQHIRTERWIMQNRVATTFFGVREPRPTELYPTTDRFGVLLSELVEYGVTPAERSATVNPHSGSSPTYGEAFAHALRVARPQERSLRV